MYDLTVGPKPVDVAPAPLPLLCYPAPFRPAWAPYQVQAPSNDALFPSEWTFDLTQVYNPSADGNAQADLTATGKLPVNRFIPDVGAPVITSGSITQSTTGGSIPGGTTPARGGVRHQRRRRPDAAQPDRAGFSFRRAPTRTSFTLSGSCGLRPQTSPGTRSSSRPKTT